MSDIEVQQPDEQQPEPEATAPDMTIAIGDVVVLKSGGPPMTVYAVAPPDVACTWFNSIVGLSPTVGRFPAACLRAVAVKD
jgi:uncharacterized protein YodC (DUF2158 family)